MSRSEDCKDLFQTLAKPRILQLLRLRDDVARASNRQAANPAQPYPHYSALAVDPRVNGALSRRA